MLKEKLKKIISTFILGTMIFSVGGQGLTVHGSTIEATDVVTQASVSTPEVTKPTIKDGNYTVNNNVEYIAENESSNIETGNTMARNALGKTTNISIADGKIEMTLSFDGTLFAFMKDLKIYLDGQDLNGKVNDSEKTIVFEVPSIDSKVQVDMFISIMGKNVSFYVTNEIDELPVVEDKEEVITPEAPVILEDGSYKATNITRYITDNATGDESARRALETGSLIKVENGKIYMTLTFSSMFAMLQNITVSLKDEEIEYQLNNETREITFEVPVANTEVLLGMDIKGMNHPVSFFVKNDMATLEKVVTESKPEDDGLEDGSGDGEDNGSADGDNGTDEGTDGSGSGSGSGSGTGSETVVGTKVYSIKNDVTHENETGVTMARKVLSDISKIEEIDGKYYATLTFTEFGSTMMTDYVVYVNGNKVTTTKVVNGNIISLRFELSSLDDSLEVSGLVSAMNKSVDFGVDLLKDTLTLITDGSSGGTTDDTTGGTTGGSIGGTTDSTTTGGTEEKKEDEEQIVTGKLYSIQNDVLHESETGRAMARKYLESTSKVEEINGVYYVTLTFTGASFMQSHQIYVNGSLVNITKSTSGDITNVRFIVPSLGATIKVKTYVAPMDREVEFEVVLLQDTLTFIKEYTVDTLPNTGAEGAAALAGLGFVFTAAGTVLAKKRK